MNGDEAAVFLQMPKSTLLKLCSEGQLPGVKVGRQWRFHRDALEKWKNDRAGSAADFPEESGTVGEPVPLDFSQNLSKAESKIEKTIPPVVEEVIGSVGGDDFGATGDVVELDSISEGVGEVRELEETTKPGRRGPAARSASAIELMAQISEKSHGRRGKGTRGRPPGPSKTPPSKPTPAAVAAAAAARETSRESRPDDGAVEISRPYNRQAAAAPVPPAPRRKSSGGAFQAIKKVAYWAVVIVVLALAGLGVKSMLVPVTTAPVASTDKALPEVPALPEFQVVYRHNEEEDIKQDNLAVPTPPPAAPVAAEPVTAPAQAETTVAALQEPAAPTTEPQAPAAAQEGAQQPAVPIATAPPVNRGLESINRLLPVLFELSGTTITSNNNEIRITFQEGVFTSGVTVSNNGRAQLGRVAEFLKANAPDFWVIIEGQTDSTAVRPNSPFRDNYTLGLRRAVAATEVMRSDAEFPTDRLLASSAGGLKPPFPEEEPGSAARNRTVVLRLVPRIVE